MTILAVHIRLLYKFENNQKQLVLLGVVDMRQLLLKLVYGPFWQSNMHCTFDFCPSPAKKKINAPLHKRS